MSDPQFYTQDLDATNIVDLLPFLKDPQFRGIVSERQGGIIAYAHSSNATTIVEALNKATEQARPGRRTTVEPWQDTMTFRNDGFVLSHNGSEWAGTYATVLGAAIRDLLEDHDAEDRIQTNVVMQVEENDGLKRIIGSVVSINERHIVLWDGYCVPINAVLAITF